MQINWDDESIKKTERNFRDFDKFQVKQGVVHRICLIETNLVKDTSHYIRDFGHAGCLKKEDGVTPDPEKCPLCIDARNKGKNGRVRSAGVRIGCNILEYVVDEAGMPVLGPKGELEFAIKAFVVGANPFVDLRNLKKQTGDLNKVDLLVTTKNPTFQEMTFMPAMKEGRIYAEWLLTPERKQAVSERYNKDKYDMSKIFKQYSYDDLQKMALGTYEKPQRGNNRGGQQQQAPAQPQGQPQTQHRANAAVGHATTPAGPPPNVNDILAGIDNI